MTNPEWPGWSTVRNSEKLAYLYLTDAIARRVLELSAIKNATVKVALTDLVWAMHERHTMMALKNEMERSLSVPRAYWKRNTI